MNYHTTERYALCQEIRAANFMESRRDGKHWWALAKPYSYGFQMQTITCACCGNYIFAAQSRYLPDDITFYLPEQISNYHNPIAYAAQCTDTIHIRITLDIIDDEVYE